MNINPIFKYSFALRILATPLLFLTRNSIPYTVLLLVFLDIVDCNPLILKMFPKEELEKHQYCTLNHEYVVIDKIIDVLQYCVAIYFLSSQLPKHVLHVLMGFTLTRIIGIFFHIKTKNPTYFVIFFDFIKEYLLLFYIYQPHLTLELLVQTMIGKIAFEYAMHKKHIFKTLYSMIFE
jgi:hypothetical protein